VTMGFLEYGKKSVGGSPKVAVVLSPGDEDRTEEDPQSMQIRRLAEKTGVKDPAALIKLIHACMDASQQPDEEDE